MRKGQAQLFFQPPINFLVLLIIVGVVIMIFNFDFYVNLFKTVRGDEFSYQLACISDDGEYDISYHFSRPGDKIIEKECGSFDNFVVWDITVPGELRSVTSGQIVNGNALYSS